MLPSDTPTEASLKRDPNNSPIMTPFPIDISFPLVKSFLLYEIFFFYIISILNDFVFPY